VGITVQVIGLEPEDVQVAERHINGTQSVVFIELGGSDCKVTLAGRLNRLQQVTAEMAHQLAQIEEEQRATAGQ
jgi:DNA relaxase NicK